MSDIKKWKKLIESMDLKEDPVADADYTDHEVSMAKSQLLSSMKSVNRIAGNLKDRSESEGLEGWVASKLTMAEDYLQAVADYMDGQEINEGYKVLPPMDKEKYQARDGLEGPFSTLSGKVVYYDPKAGKYYDPDTDMYMSYDEFRRYDDDYKGMKDERDEVKEGDDTVKVVFRKFDNGDVIALFPEEEQGRGLITSYMEIGQHSDASKSLITDLEPASKEEYAELAAELKRIGYDIVIAESVNTEGLDEEKQRLDPKCWDGYKIGNPKTKMKGGKRVNNCVPK